MFTLKMVKFNAFTAALAGYSQDDAWRCERAYELHSIGDFISTALAQLTARDLVRSGARYVGAEIYASTSVVSVGRTFNEGMRDDAGLVWA